MFHISSHIVLFVWEGQGSYGGIKINFHLGMAKGRGKRAVWGEKPKIRVLFAKFLF